MFGTLICMMWVMYITLLERWNWDQYSIHLVFEVWHEDMVAEMWCTCFWLLLLGLSGHFSYCCSEFHVQVCMEMCSLQNSYSPCFICRVAVVRHYGSNVQMITLWSGHISHRLLDFFS